ncbi:MAG: hypothetical protein M3297_04270 [Thermoproteota archaeon]|nr:hypothetical protein [Thermoproteota archaeon]
MHESCQPACITSQCKRGQCLLVLPSQGVLSIDCDKCGSFPRGKKKPDFIVLYERGGSSIPIWNIVEMKKSVGHLGRIIEQLQAGADTIQNHPAFEISSPSQQLVPLLLHDRHIRTADLARRRITFRGSSVPVIYKRCGMRLEDES